MAREQAGGSLRGSTSSPGQRESPRPGVLEGRGPSRFPARPPPLSLGKLAAARCRGLFLGVEGEGNGKRDRELGRWGREVWERVFLVAVSFMKSDTTTPRSVKAFLLSQQTAGPRPGTG